MKLISHRGNINGANPELENSPAYIDAAIAEGFDVEIDVWTIEGDLFLGHDFPQYKTSIEWLGKRNSNLWIHCKNLEAITFFSSYESLFGSRFYSFNFFWHESDKVTLTSKCAIWAFPGNQPIPGSVAVMPEIHNDDLSQCFAVCSDYVMNYK
jgi:hypothetical protein